MTEGWKRYTKDVKRLGRRQPIARDSIPAPTALPQILCRGGGVGVGEEPRAIVVALGRRAERKFKQGDIVLDARLDLHGKTQQAAYEALIRFVETQSARGKRKLLVITGKGTEGRSVLRANLPRWCAEPVLARHILTLCAAAPQHGGGGAWYIVLRRNGPNGKSGDKRR